MSGPDASPQEGSPVSGEPADTPDPDSAPDPGAAPETPVDAEEAAPQQDASPSPPDDGPEPDEESFQRSRTRPVPRQTTNFQGQGTRVDATEASDEERGRFQSQQTRLDVLDPAVSEFPAERTRLNVFEERPQGSDPLAPTVDKTRRVERPVDEPAGIRIGAYTLEERLGEGGMASVFLARSETGEAVALKILSSAIDDDTVRARFQREGDTLRELDHPGIVRLLDRGEDERTKRPYLVMELVEGRDLARILHERPSHKLYPDELVYLLSKAASALATAHEQGIVHRDVKPGNLLLTPLGQIKLTDFGIAFSQESQARLTAGGALVGTPSYLAPEVLLGEPWSPAADVYALGSTAFEALTGRLLFDADTAIEILSDQIQTPAPKLATLTDVPIWLSELVDRMLSKGPDLRPSAAELVERLAAYLPASESLEQLWQGASRQGSRGGAVRGGAIAEPGDRILNYRLEEELGRGAVGVVFRAYHEGLKKEVALKLLDAMALLGGSDEERQRRETRFLREAQAVATLKHPCVVPILDAGRHEGFYYIAMELVEGQSLTRVMSAEALSIEARVRLMADLCAGVAHAHARGVIHRDLKPDNVIVSEEDGRPRVLDFGVAKLSEEQDDLTGEELGITTEGSLVGTVQYMAPEQAAGKHSRVDVRSDVYALGVIFYELLCGRPPHLGSVRELIYQINFEDPLPPSAYRSRLPWELDAIALKALQRDPDERYQSALELHRDLERYLAGEPILAKAGSPWYLVRKYVERNRARVITAALATLLLLSLLAAWAASAAASAAEQERLALQAEAAREVEVAKRHDSVRDLVRRAWEAFHTGAFAEAAELFSSAQSQVEPDELIAPTAAGLALVPVEAISDLRSDQRGLLRLTAARLREWVLLARQREQQARIAVRVEAAQAALAGGDLGKAAQEVIAARSLGGPGAARAASEAVAAAYVAQALRARERAPEGDLPARRQRLEEAQRSLGEAQRLVPGVAQADLSALLRELGKLGELEEREAVARAQDQRSTELAREGRDLLAASDLDAARRAFEQALGMNGANQDAREGLLLVERALRERDEARAMAERLRQAGELRTYAENAQRLGQARYGTGELPEVVREPYTDALEALRRASLLAPDDPLTAELLQAISREYAAVLIDQGHVELAQFVRRLAGLPEQDPEPVALPLDPHVAVIEVVANSARVAFGTQVVFQPTREFDALRDYVKQQTPNLRFELRVLGTVSREGLVPKVTCNGIEIRMFDRRRNTVSPPQRVMFEGEWQRPTAVDPQGRRVLRPFTRATRLDAAPFVTQVTLIVQRMVQANKD